jgi:hypothetical protein
MKPEGIIGKVGAFISDRDWARSGFDRKVTTPDGSVASPSEDSIGAGWAARSPLSKDAGESVAVPLATSETPDGGEPVSLNGWAAREVGKQKIESPRPREVDVPEDERND